MICDELKDSNSVEMSIEQAIVLILMVKDKEQT